MADRVGVNTRGAGEPRSPSTALPTTQPITHGDLRGEICSSLVWSSTADQRAALDALVATMVTGGGARTLHHGRNLVCRTTLATAEGPRSVVVKRFGVEGWWHRSRRRLRGAGKAQQSFTAARALARAGVATPTPLLYLETADLAKPSYYVSAALEEVVEARAVVRALNAGEPPAIAETSFLTAVATAARKLHDAGFWHRDFSAGNLLLEVNPGAALPLVAIVDLNRLRVLEKLSLAQRMRDLCRLPLARVDHQEALLLAYFASDPQKPASQREPVPAGALRLYRTFKHSFEARHRRKRALRESLARWRGRLVSRGTFAHLPAAAPGAPLRDRAVWDQLSDQPHLHAGRWEKVGARLADAPAQLRELGGGLAALPRVRQRYRELTAAAGDAGRPFAGLGVAVRPIDNQELLFAALADLGVGNVLVRLHPWDSGAAREAEVALVGALAAQGYEVSLALPQDRALVRDPPRYHAAAEELAERLGSMVKAIQIGQAINRSKWGVWSLADYARLAAPAIESWRQHAPGVTILGGAVIDFEPHVTLAFANGASGLRFDGLASLLYVDRRGAPEARQLGFDAVAKATLIKAIADTARVVGPRSFITEVNWPLAEGPHSPAGRLVAVDEDSQADFLVRFFAPVLAAGVAERIFWWQLFAKGYGLADPLVAGLPRRRAAFDALATLARQLTGTVTAAAIATTPGTRALQFTCADGGELVLAWSTDTRREPGSSRSLTLPRPVATLLDRDGRALTPPPGCELPLGPGPRYARLVDP